MGQTGTFRSSLIQIIACTDQDRQAIGHHPLDERHLALLHPGGWIERRVVQEGFTEHIPDTDDIPADKGSVQTGVQLWSNDAVPLAVGIAAAQRVARRIQANR